MLSERVASSYKNGGNEALAILLSAQTFDELVSNAYYIEKINEADRAVIAEIEEIRAQLEQQKQNLEDQKAELEALEEEQAEQLAQMQAKQQETQELLNSRSSSQNATRRSSRLRRPRRKPNVGVRRRLRAAPRARRPCCRQPVAARIIPLPVPLRRESSTPATTQPRPAWAGVRHG